MSSDTYCEEMNVADPPTIAAEIRYLSLFTGVGMLDVGFGLACEFLGLRSRVLGYVEREAYAAACLLARMEDEALEPAPIWCGDLRDFPREPFRGRVDCITGGFPCQDISLAGRGDGIEGERSGLWFDMLDTACDLGCSMLALENVAAITIRGLDAVCGSLAERGFDAEWLCLPASAVGVSHKRNRWFCLAHRDGNGLRRFGESRTRQPRNDADDCDQAMGDSPERQVGQHAGAKSKADRPLFAPGPNADWAAIVEQWPHLAPAVEPGFRVLVDELALVVDESRADQLRATGNGVVPAQAAAAFVELFRRCGLTKLAAERANEGRLF